MRSVLEFSLLWKDWPGSVFVPLNFFSFFLFTARYDEPVELRKSYIEDITWPRGDTNFIFEY